MALSGAALPVFSARTRLLVVAPHPDDETIANGILIQRVLAAGGAVRVLLLTDGDNNPWPQRWLERRWCLGAQARARWGRRRRAELGEALARLGLPATALWALGWPDMGVRDRLLRATETALAELTAAVRDFSPDVVALPALTDRHPDHGSAHVLLRLALARLAGDPILLAYAIHGDDAPAAAEASAWQLAKQHALSAHASQLALSGQRFHRLAGRAERHARVAAAPVAAPRLLPWQPAPWLRPWLRLTAVHEAGTVRQWRWREAPLRRDGQGGWWLDGAAAPAGTACFVRMSLELPSPWIYDRWGWCAV
jgi:LmbE family N-acetylglucosaminyl deacetylase